MEKLTFNATFQGDLADRHVVPAYDSINALYGVTRSILIPTHYALEGKVKHRNINSPKYNLYLKPPVQGSVDFPFELFFAGAAIVANHPVVTGTMTSLLSDFVTNSIKRAVGKSDKITADELEKLIDEGTKDAIAAAMEPSLRAGHNIINNGVINININSGGGNVTLDNSTKTYLNNFHISDQPSAKLMSVSSYNANSKSGAAFDKTEGRVIPFFLKGSPDALTLRTISNSQSAYIDFQITEKQEDRDRAFIAIQHYKVHDSQDKLKRIQVLKARPSLDEM